MLKAVAVVLFLSMVGYSVAESDCIEDRNRRINSTIDTTDIPMLHLIPECDENGDYSALQCFTQKPWCVCYRRDGTNIGTPSRSIIACDCVRARDDARTNAEAFRPRCQRNGTYSPKQCLLRECWCVDKDGNVLTDPSSGDVKC